MSDSNALMWTIEQDPLRRGAEIVQQLPFGPLSGAAANITLLSWLDQVCIGVNLDPSAGAGVDAFHGCLAEGFDEVIAAG